MADRLTADVLKLMKRLNNMKHNEWTNQHPTIVIGQRQRTIQERRTTLLPTLRY